MLTIDSLDAGYNEAPVLHGLSLSANTGEVLCLLGRNGAGKTTTLKAILGLVAVSSGSVKYDHTELTSVAPHQRPQLGIGYVPQGRRLFAELTVDENLQIGERARAGVSNQRERIFSMFPVLRDRLRQKAGTLSGGEQQMLATARALCLDPSLLLMDEPTEGLQPSMIALIRDVILELRRNGVTIVLVEQRVDAVIPVADRVAFIENGRHRETVPVESLHNDLSLIHRYVGVGQ